MSLRSNDLKSLNFYRKLWNRNLASLDNSIRQPVIKGIKKSSKILSPKQKVDTALLLEIRKTLILTDFLKYGIRVVYNLEQQDGLMKIIIVSAMTDNKVYEDAGREREMYGFKKELSEKVLCFM